MVLNRKQKRAFQTVLSGLKFSKYGNKPVRFLTLTTSDLQYNKEDYDPKVDLEKDMKIFIKRIKRYSPIRLYKEGYISENKMRSKYRSDGIYKKFIFEYFRVETSEGNGVMHITYRGSYLPYNFLVDNWQEIHNSWDLNIKMIDLSDPKDASGYIVSQYMSSQRSSYIRSSQSWNWVFRGFKDLWYRMVHWYKDDLFDIWDRILAARAAAYFYSQKQLADFG